MNSGASIPESKFSPGILAVLTIAAIYAAGAAIIVGVAVATGQESDFLTFQLLSLSGLMITALAVALWVIGDLGAAGGAGLTLFGLATVGQAYTRFADVLSAWQPWFAAAGFVGALLLLLEVRRQSRARQSRAR